MRISYVYRLHTPNGQRYLCSPNQHQCDKTRHHFDDDPRPASGPFSPRASPFWGLGRANQLPPTFLFMKKFTLVFLLSNLAQLAVSQSNPNDVSVFFRVEAPYVQFIGGVAGSSGYQISDLPPAWLEAYPPTEMNWHLATPTTGTLSKLVTFKYERFPDCRIKTIRIQVPGFPTDYFRTDFEYDIPNRQILATDYEVDQSTGLPEYYWRFRITYDSDENIVKIERIWWDEIVGDWDPVPDVWDYTNWDACGNYGHIHLVEGGSFVTDYAFTRSYVPGGGCRVDSETGISGNNTTTYQWNHDSNGRVIRQIETSTSPGGSSSYVDTLVYDAQGRRSILEGDIVYTKIHYDWNSDNSLNWLEYNSPGNGGDTLYRKIFVYGPCDVVPVLEPEKVASQIRVESPVNSGTVAHVFGLPSEEVVSWQMSNAQGQIIETGKLEQGVSKLPVPARLPPGVYFLNLFTATQRWSSRVLVH